MTTASNLPVAYRPTRADVDWGGLLHTADHRPWAAPRRGWVMTMTWADLLFAHWRVDADVLAAALPAELELDTFEGEAWVGVVPFRMDDTGVRGLPSPPSLATFPELNVRTYVRNRQGDPRPGVWFFSLDADCAPAVWGARTFFHLPYFHATMSMSVHRGTVTYASRRYDPRIGGGVFRGSYRPMSARRLAEPGTLEHWLTERYCLYAASASGRVIRSEVHHPPWPLRDAAAEIVENTVCDAHGIELSDPLRPELLHFVPAIHVLGRVPTRVR